MTAVKRKRRTLSIKCKDQQVLGNQQDENDKKPTCTTLIKYKPLQQFLGKISINANIKSFENDFKMHLSSRVPKTVKLRVPANRIDVFEELSKEVYSRVSPMEEAVRFFDDFFGSREENRRTSILVRENEDFEAAIKPMLGCLDFFKECWLSESNHQIGKDYFRF